jgi:hypothetical protein
MSITEKESTNIDYQYFKKTLNVKTWPPVDGYLWGMLNVKTRPLLHPSFRARKRSYLYLERVLVS